MNAFEIVMHFSSIKHIFLGWHYILQLF